MLKFEPTVLKPPWLMTGFVESLLTENVDQTSSLGRSKATSLAGFPCRRAKLTRCRYRARSGITNDHGLWALRAAAAYIRHPGSPASSGEYGQPCPTNWLMPCKKCRSASAFRSRDRKSVV